MAIIKVYAKPNKLYNTLILDVILNKLLNQVKKNCFKTSIFLTFILLIIGHRSFSKPHTDSIKVIKISSLNDLAFEQININPELAFKYVNSSLDINTIDSLSHIEFSKSYTILGILNKNKGFYQIAVSNYLKALQLSESLKDWNRVSVYYNNIGVIYHLNGKYEDALSYYIKSVYIEKSIGTKEQLSIRYYNIGESYQAMNYFDSSLFYFNTSLKIEQELESELGIIYALHGLSNLHLSEQNYDSAQYYMEIIKGKKDTLNDLELNCKILIISIINLVIDIEIWNLFWGNIT